MKYAAHSLSLNPYIWSSWQLIMKCIDYLDEVAEIALPFDNILYRFFMVNLALNFNVESIVFEQLDYINSHGFSVSPFFTHLSAQAHYKLRNGNFKPQLNIPQ